MVFYPASAKATGVQGTVILHAVVGMDGRPLSLRVMNNDIDPEQARAAIEGKPMALSTDTTEWRADRNRHDDYGEFFFGVVSIERS
jgi:hypothetical protein